MHTALEYSFGGLSCLSTQLLGSINISLHLESCSLSLVIWKTHKSVHHNVLSSKNMQFGLALIIEEGAHAHTQKNINTLVQDLPHFFIKIY